MKLGRSNRISTVLLVLISTVFIFMHTDRSKRAIASFEHKLSIPDYLQNIRLKSLSFGFREPVTSGQIEKSRIKDLYRDMNGEQIMVNSLPVGRAEALDTLKAESFTMVYRNDRGNLNGINFTNKNEFYFELEIESHFE